MRVTGVLLSEAGAERFALSSLDLGYKSSSPKALTAQQPMLPDKLLFI